MILIAAVLRFYALDKQPLWYDELISMSLGLFRGGLEAIWNVRYYPHPPLYPAFLHFWLQILPAEEFSLRLPSVLAGLLALPILYRFIAHTVGPRAALAGITLLAFSPFHIYFSQEARPYSILFTLALFTAFVLYKALESNGAGWWFLHFVSLLALLYLHFFNWAIVGSEVLFVLLTWREHRKSLLPFALSLLAAPVSVFPLLHLARDSISAGHVLVLNMIPTSIAFPSTWKTLIAGESRYVSENLRLSGTLAFGVLGLLGGVRLGRFRPKLLALVGCMLIVPFAFVFIVLPALGHVIPPYEEKMFIVTLPFAMILAAAGIEFLLAAPASRATQQANRIVAILTLAVLLGGNLLALKPYYTSFVKNADVRVVDFLESNVEAGDIVISDGFSMAMNLKYHWDAEVLPDFAAWAHKDNGEWRFDHDLSSLPEDPITRDITLDDLFAYRRIWLISQPDYGHPDLATDLEAILPPQAVERMGPFIVTLFVPHGTDQ